jgi:hypothetical protein
MPTENYSISKAISQNATADAEITPRRLMEFNETATIAIAISISINSAWPGSRNDPA